MNNRRNQPIYIYGYYQESTTYMLLKWYYNVVKSLTFRILQYRVKSRVTEVATVIGNDRKIISHNGSIYTIGVD